MRSPAFTAAEGAAGEELMATDPDAIARLQRTRLNSGQRAASQRSSLGQDSPAIANSFSGMAVEKLWPSPRVRKVCRRQ